MDGYFLGLDLGTSGIKAGIVDQYGVIVADLYWDTELVSISPGCMEQDPDVILNQTLKIIKDVIEKAQINPNNIIGLAIDGQMGGIIGIDRQGKSLTGLDMGLDIRSERYNRMYHELVGDAVVQIACGSPRNTPKIMMWKRERPSLYQQVFKFVTLSCYIGAQLAGLTGDDAYIDYTLLSFFGNEDAHSLSWSKELTEACNLDLDKFPRVVQPWDRIGSVTKSVYEKTLLPEGVPIFAGSGDQPAGFLGAGFLDHGSFLDVSGSTTLLCCASDSHIPDKNNHAVMYMPSVIRGKYTAFTYINGGGINLKWFRDELSPSASWKELAENIDAIPPGSCGLLFSPYFGGRQCPYDDAIRGSWIGMNWGHSKYHLFRALLEGLTYDYSLGRDYIATIIPFTNSDKIAGIGGGTKDKIWNQMKSNVMNVVYDKKPEQQYALRGCALIAGYGLGMYTDLVESSMNMQENEGELFYPDKNIHTSYIPYIEAFKKIYDVPLAESMRTLVDLLRN